MSWRARAPIHTSPTHLCTSLLSPTSAPCASRKLRGDPLLANFRKMAATQAKIYAAGWGAMNDTVREERGLVQSTKL